MQHETKPESADAKRTLAGSAVGYGIVCGLTFPLMISSTFLQEMSLSHGAGDAFGALFFLAYALTMAGTALAYALRRKPTRRARIVSAFAAAFLGNALMFARLVGLIEGGWPYAIAASSLIGYGLATAELAWMARITSLHERGQVSLARTVPLSFLCGGAVAAVIFVASGTFELLFALAIIVVSALPLVRTAPIDATARRVSLAQGGAGDFVKAVSYLAVFSFVFGAVSQVATVVEEPVPIAAQAVLGILLAAGIMLAYVVRKRHALSVGDLYDILFPIVAVALIALPFITSPIVHVIAAVLVFVAFYLSGMNVRIAVCLLGERDHVSMWVYLSVALGGVGAADPRRRRVRRGGDRAGHAGDGTRAHLACVAVRASAQPHRGEAAGNPTRAEGSAVVVACTRDERRAHDASRPAALVRRRPCPHRP